jgi:hypothetical protein
MAEALAIPIDRAQSGRGWSYGADLRRQCWRLWSELDAIWRERWLPTVEDIIRYIQPNRGEFTEQDVNRGDRRDTTSSTTSRAIRWTVWSLRSTW